MESKLPLEVRDYLDEVRSCLHLDPHVEKRIIGELYTYFQESVAELQEKGFSEEAAAGEAIKSFGRARVVARLMYEAYSKGSWIEALISAIPHLVIAALFVSHLWNHPVLAPLVFVSIICVTLFGWWHGKPNWFYSWVGYSFIPLIIGAYLSRTVLEETASFILWGQDSLPDAWVLLLVCVLLVSSLWIIIRATVLVVRRDWILASLMLVPLPILVSWLFSMEQVGGLFGSSGPVLYQWDAAMASVLIVLAGASAIFIRLRLRVLKEWALVTLGVIAFTKTGQILWGGFWTSGTIDNCSPFPSVSAQPGTSGGGSRSR
jgi:hypothetical protein